MSRQLGRRALGRVAAGLLAGLPVVARPEDAAARRRIRIGTWGGGGCSAGPRIAEFEQWLGRRMDLVLDFVERGSWDKMVNSGNWVAECWQKTRYPLETRYPLALGVPMLVEGSSKSLQRGADGAYDAHFRQLADRLIAHGQAAAILRLGWEFNGNWYKWAAQRDPEAFPAFWRRIVAEMRRAPGAQFRFDWNPALTAEGPTERVYPGDDVVDFIGLDVYNQAWPRTEDPGRRWRYLLEHRSGLRWHRDFAAARGKPRSFPEWGTGTRQDGHGGGDDPLFVRNMLAWMSEGGPVEYACYWNDRAPEYDAKVTDGRLPAAAAVLRAGLQEFM